MARFLVIFSLLISVLSTIKCNNNDHCIDPPFGLEWNMSFSDFADYVKNDTSGNVQNIEAIREYSKCDKFTRSSLGGKYSGNVKWVDVYFWNDSLFRIEFFADIEYPLEPIEPTTMDELADMANDTLGKKIESKSIEEEVDRIKKMIVANHEDCINKKEIDTVYWETKMYGHFMLDDSIQRMTRNITYIGYNNTRITISVTTDRNTYGTFQTRGSLIALIAYSSPYSKHMYDALDNWQDEHGKIYHNKSWSGRPGG